ncbi:MAG: hypothetical protein QOD93_2284, partial [Acetobacteraceae bacterium]|nr:hypothetical protein [Acetobacteraceae bacterium]
MSFIVAGCVLLLALFVGIVVDSVGVTRGEKARRDLPSFDAWGTQGPMDCGGAGATAKEARTQHSCHQTQSSGLPGAS